MDALGELLARVLLVPHREVEAGIPDPQDGALELVGPAEDVHAIAQLDGVLLAGEDLLDEALVLGPIHQLGEERLLGRAVALVHRIVHDDRLILAEQGAQRRLDHDVGVAVLTPVVLRVLVLRMRRSDVQPLTGVVPAVGLQDHVGPEPTHVVVWDPCLGLVRHLPTADGALVVQERVLVDDQAGLRVFGHERLLW